MHSFELKSLDRPGVGIGFPLGPPRRPRPHNHCQRYPEAMAGFSLNHRPPARRGEAAENLISFSGLNTRSLPAARAPAHFVFRLEPRRDPATAPSHRGSRNPPTAPKSELYPRAPGFSRGASRAREFFEHEKISDPSLPSHITQTGPPSRESQPTPQRWSSSTGPAAGSKESSPCFCSVIFFLRNYLVPKSSQ
jgi:hypothetical protein